ncbi:MAG TPA: substrate-binding domain-containing protein, partial [Luteolibacter sp.]
ATRCPVVSLNANLPPGLEIPVVTPDNAEAGRMAARHLIAQGHRDFAFYSPAGGTVAIERKLGFEEVIRNHGYELHDLGTRSTTGKLAPWSAQRVRLAAQLRKLPPRTGVLALDDLVAADIIEVAVENGLKIPENLSVVGLGNLGAVCQCSPIPITSIDLRAGEVARRGAELLGKLLAGGKKPSPRLRVPPGDLIVRESSDTIIVRESRLAAAVKFIEKNIRHPLSLDQVAESCGVSRRTLYHLFDTNLGISPADFIKRQRSQLLDRLRHEHPEMPREKLARAAGFTCVRTMDRLVRRHE